MLTSQVALIDQTGAIDPTQMAAVAAALSIQVTRDLSQFWPVSATVQALSPQVGVPPGFFPIFIVASLPPGEGGVHLSSNNQPYANVEAGNGWMLAASHELCEMLVDPSTNLLHTATAITLASDGTVQDTSGQFEYLVEVCDPSESPDHGYVINGVPVSDFYTPNYFDPVTSAAVRYSFTGALTAPRQVLKGGYLSWHDPVQGIWQQLDFVSNDTPAIVTLSGMTSARSLREGVDRQMRTTRSLSATADNHQLMQRASARREFIRRAGRANAAHYPTVTARG